MFMANDDPEVLYRPSFLRTGKETETEIMPAMTDKPQCRPSGGDLGRVRGLNTRPFCPDMLIATPAVRVLP